MGDGELPPGWAWAQIGQLCELFNGRAFKPTDWEESGLPIIRIQNLNNRRAAFNHYPGAVDDRHLVADGDLLFAWSGTPGTSFGAHVWRGPKAVLNQHIFKVILDPNLVDRDYFRHAINQSLEAIIAQAHGGAGLAHITKGRFEDTVIPLPPLRQQVRIANAIETNFEELDEAEAALARARDGVGQFRASLLHAACTGQLTAAWREANPSAETGADLLRRILAERRAAWERTERARLKAKGTPPRGDGAKARYEEPAVPDATGLPELPTGWAWVTIDHLIRETPRNGVSVQGSAHPPGIAALRLDALGENGLRFDRRRYIEISDAKAEALYIVEGDFLVSRANGSPAFVARACVASQPPDEVIFPDTMIRFRFHHLVCPAWLASVWKSDFVRRQILGKVKTSAGILKISQDDLLSIVIPAPPIPEQNEAVRLIDELSASVGDTDNLADSETRSRLRQSILHAAFTGKLVPQNQSDEPAAALLARLRDGPATARRARRRAPSEVSA